jgi:hypothetical protein
MNVHVHALVIDGVFTGEGEASPQGGRSVRSSGQRWARQPHPGPRRFVRRGHSSEFLDGVERSAHVTDPENALSNPAAQFGLDRTAARLHIRAGRFQRSVFHLDEYVGLPIEQPASFRRYLRERLIEKTGIRRWHF